jgi:hypothetical protein
LRIQQFDLDKTLNRVRLAPGLAQQGKVEDQPMSRPRRSTSSAGHRRGERRPRRPRRSHRPLIAIEALEGRTLLSVSNLSFAALSATEGLPVAQFQGEIGTDALATFTDANPGLGPQNFSASLQWGDGAYDTDVGRGGGILILPDPNVANQWDVYDLPSSYSSRGGHAYQEEGVYNLVLSVTDLTDGGSGLASERLIVHDAPLSATGVGSIAPVEGIPFTGTLATFTDADPGGVLGEYAATVDWGDGSTSAATITQPGGGGTPFVVSGTHTFAEDGTYPNTSGNGPVTVTIVDTDGQSPPQGTRATTTVTDSAVVGDAPLTALPLTIPFTAVEGLGAAGVLATFADANPAATASDFSGTIAWGDGSTSAFTSASLQLVSRSATQAIFNVFASHTYAEDGSSPLAVTINDVGGATVTARSTARVQDAPLSAAVVPIAATQGLNFTGVVASFTDSNPSASASDFSGTINWGDGTTSAFTSADVSLVTRTTTQAQFVVNASHTYAEDGIYSAANSDPVQVTIDDAGGSTASITGAATVADAPITASPAVVNPNPLEGNPFSAIVATFTTPNTLAVPGGFSAAINWGDGSPPTVGVVTQPGGPGTAFRVSGTHTYAEESPAGQPYTVSVLVVDTAGSASVPLSNGSAIAQVTVADAQLTGSYVPIGPSAGIPFIGEVAAFTDGDPVAPLADYPNGSVTIAWGDGSTSMGTVTQPGGVGTSFVVTGTHTYSSPGTYSPVTVTIKDSGGSQLVLGGQATVAVAPLLAAPVSFTQVEGARFTAEVSTFVNANPYFPTGNPPGSAYSATISWGDGSTSTATIQPDPSSLGRFDVLGTHTYIENGIYTTQVAITDTQGATPTAPVTATVTVLDASLTGTTATFRPIEGLPFAGTVATFTDANPYGVTGDFTATIDWGDGLPNAPDLSTGAISQPGGPGTPFVVSGTHTYAQEGIYTGVIVTITSVDVPPQPSPITPSSTTVASTAVVADAPLTATTDPYPVATVEGSSFPDTFPKQYPGAGVVVATFTDGDPTTWPNTADFSATILWSPLLSNAIIATPGQVIADPTTPGQFDVLGNHIYPGAGIDPVTVLIGDIGGSTTMATGAATVNDAPLTAFAVGTPSHQIPSVAGSTFRGAVARFNDANPSSAAGDYAATIAWGDGQTSAGTIQPDPAGGFDVFGTHAYVQDGDYLINTTITSIDVPPPIVPSTTATTSPIAVLDAPISADTAPLPAGVEGSAYAGPVTVATFTDGNPYAVSADFSAVITWGDGSTSTGAVIADSKIVGQFDVQADHVYLEDGIYLGSVAITDSASSQAVPAATATVPLSATIDDAPLTAGPVVSMPAQTEGSSFTAVLATFTDGNPYANDPASYIVSINWGDGSTPSSGIVKQIGPATFEVLGSHTYTHDAPDGGPTGSQFTAPYRVTVQITDTDSDVSPPPSLSIPRSGTAVVTSIAVADAALSLKIASVPAQTEGQSSSFTLGTLTDSSPYGSATDYTGTIAWGDNTTTTLVASNFVPVANSPGVFTIVAAHTYAEEGSYSATIQVFDIDGGVRSTTSPLTASTTATTSIAVNDAPLASVGSPQTIATTSAGSPITEGNPTGAICVAILQDGNPDATPADYSVTIAWGDGTTSPGTVQPSLSPGLFNVFGNHTYLEQGTYNNIAVTVVDDGGASTVATSTSIVVADAPLYPGTTPVTINTFAGTPIGEKIAATFADGNPFATPDDYAATIFWGDGSSSPADSILSVMANSSEATFAVIGNHTYAYNGTYVVLVTVDDTDGTSSIGASCVVSVTRVIVSLDPPGGVVSSNGNPLTANGVALTTTEAKPFSGTVATFTYAMASVPSEFTAAINWGDGQSSSGIIAYDPNLGGFTVTGSHTYARAGSYHAVATIQDQGGNSAQATATASVADAPISAAGVALSITEGTAFSGVVATFTDPDPGAVATDYTATIAWGDGTTSAGSIAFNPARAAFTVSGSHTYAQAGSYAAVVSIGDYGGSKAQANDAATIADAPLTAVGTALSATEGTAFSGVVATFTDPDPAATVADYSATIAWGDGTTSAGSIAFNPTRAAFTVSGAHTYARAGSYAAAVSIGDYGGSRAQASAPATIADAPLTAAGTALSATEGTAFSGVVATFTDPDPAAAPSDYTATIAWGDGQSSAGSIAFNPALAAFTVSGAHTYSQPDSYTVVVSIGDYGGSKAQASASATIADAPLTAVGTALSATEGTAFSGVVATFTDADPAAPSDYTATIAWGDGQSSAGSIAYDAARAAFTVSGSHTYTRAGSYAAAVSIGDYGGSQAQASAPATIADAPLTAAGTALSAAEGTAFSGVVATFTDPDPAAAVADYSATIAWGDGQSSAGSIAYDPALAAFTVSGSHTYARAGSYAAVSIGDYGGSQAQASAAVTIADAPLTAVGTALSATEGAAFSGVVATFTDPDPAAAVADYSATITWGDGQSSAGSIAYDPARAAFTVSGSHTYAQPGSYTAVVSIGDYGGSKARASAPATIADAPLSANGLVLSATEGTTFSGVVATFTVADPAATASSFSATIAWGDGQSSAGSIAYDPGLAAFTVSGSHTYSHSGSYSANVVILDETDSSTRAVDTTVIAVPSPGGQSPTGTPGQVPSGQIDVEIRGLQLRTGRPHIFVGELASFIENIPTAAASDFTGRISWGDGSHSRARIIQPGGAGRPFFALGGHLYARPRRFSIRIIIRTKDRSHTASTRSTLDLAWRPETSIHNMLRSHLREHAWKRPFYWHPSSRSAHPLGRSPISTS